MSKVTKAVIPCAGMGTRFMPITKAVPKELLPVIDTPVLAYIIDEAVNSGITDVLIVTSPQKECIKKYFTPDSELEDKMLSAGKEDVYNLLKSIYSRANVHFTYQTQPKGSGDAVYHAKGFTGKEPFCLAWGDDLMVADPPVMGQLISAHEKTGGTIIGVQKVLIKSSVPFFIHVPNEAKGVAIVPIRSLGAVTPPSRSILSINPARNDAIKTSVMKNFPRKKSRIQILH